MGLNIERVEILLLIAAVVSMLARRVRLPYTVGLVLAGIGVSLLRLPIEVELTKHLIFSAFLPPLVFEAAFQMPWSGMRRDLPVTLVLATIGVVLSAAVVAAGACCLLHWPWQAALLMGVLISATDPVSVIATFKAAGVHGRLGLLVEAESLFNDGTAAVLLSVALSVVGAASANVGAGPASAAVAIATSFAVTVLGGLTCGASVAGLTLLLLGRTDDHLVAITFTTVAAYGSFLLAEHFHLSGVLATLATGVILGNVGPLRGSSNNCRESVLSFWSYICFAANSLVFLLIGMPLAHQDFLRVGTAAAVVIVLVILGRAVSVYGCCAAFAFSSALKVSASHQHVLFWGGLRGALALALVLGLPDETPMRATVVTVAFAVVAFSIVVQGLTMTPLLRRLGEIE